MSSQANSERLARLCDDLLHAIWRSNPVEATALGIHDYDHTLGDISSDAFHEYSNSLKSSIGALESQVHAASLDDDQATDHRLAQSLAATNLLVCDSIRPWARNPCLYPSLALWGCFGLLIRDYAPLEQRAGNLLSRMLEIPDMLAVSKENIVDPPPAFVDVALDVLTGGLCFFRRSMPAVAAQALGLERDILKANEAAIAAFESYDRWLRQTVLPRAQGEFAIGRDAYEQLLRTEHCLPYRPNDIILIGEEALESTEQKISEVAAKIDPSVTWHELVARLKRDHPAKEGLKDAYQRHFEAARDFVIEKDLVTIPDGEQLEIRETPEFERSITPYAAYFPPAPFDRQKTGIFWVTPINERAPGARRDEQLLGHCAYGIPVIALHEAYPGHHLQLTRALESSPIRKQAVSNLFLEGWALYCEEMMYEQGFYTDPRVRLFQLKDTLWRACRVLIDVGLHTGRMTFDEAVKMLVDKGRLEEVNAVAEVKRYTMTPTQPMTYVIGKHLILHLRSQMKQKLGDRFDLKSFHDRLLSYGSIPPPLVAERMTAEHALEALPAA